VTAAKSFFHACRETAQAWNAAEFDLAEPFWQLVTPALADHVLETVCQCIGLIYLRRCLPEVSQVRFLFIGEFFRRQKHGPDRLRHRQLRRWGRLGLHGL